MATVQTPAPSRALGMAAVAFGVLGLGFFWWVPFGLVLGLAGLLLGIVGLIMGSRRQTGLRLLAAGTLLSVCALVLDLIIALQNWELIRITALH